MDRHEPIMSEEALKLSVLDRLLDDEPTTQQEGRWQRRAVLQTLQESLSRDLCDLLNTPRWLNEIPDEYHEVAGSLANYGLPDLQSIEIREGRAVEQVSRLIENAIRQYEPRLQGVRVAPAAIEQGSQHGERRLRFEIEAVLVVEPLREPVFFATSFDSSRSEFEVE